MANIILYISIQFCDDQIFAVFAYLLSQKLQHTEIISGIVCFRIFLNQKKKFLTQIKNLHVYPILQILCLAEKTCVKPHELMF